MTLGRRSGKSALSIEPCNNARISYDPWRFMKMFLAEFLTPPIDRGMEIRCYMRDPDGYLIEVGQATGLLDMLRGQS